MGGWNVIADTLLREMPQGADPLGPENVLVFAPGVLTGLAIAGASRNAVGAKSPITGGFGATEVGGDYYDFLRGDDGSWTVALGDATGHGLHAGMVVGVVGQSV